MGDVETIRVKGKKALTNKIEDMADEGWKLESQTTTTAIMKRPGGFGRKRWHALILILTVWWAWVVPNVIYMLFSYFINVKRTIIRME